MGKKVNPLVFRLGVIEGWKSRWFQEKKYKDFLKEDHALRTFLTGKLKKLGLEKIEIERSAHKILLIIHTSRPGLIIGKGGAGIEALKSEIEKKYQAVRTDKDKKEKNEIRIRIEEIAKPEINAQIIAQSAADQLEKRLPFRRVLKQTLEKAMQNKEVKGAKIRVSGRLDGSEMSRTEWLSKGQMPLHTLRAHIDFAMANAYCTYGVIGVKVWLYKGDVFEEKKDNE